MNDLNPFEATQILDGTTNSNVERTSNELPKSIGRYRIENVLGKGGFGIVYLAFDDQLVRSVAVKVPHSSLIAKPEDAEAYLAEARTVANLDHPAIVPVYDIGKTEDCLCFIVSKYIQGTDLAAKLKSNRLKYQEVAELVAIVADALNYAHKQRLVHRDVKPGNILIDADGKPYVVDFGLALREKDVGKGPKFAGTPAYMSPEQARGEGHRVDGRSDIFSLGIVFYEALAGHPPFVGDSLTELLEQVTSFEPRPLVQFHDKLPKELQRICQKALSKRASERYQSADEMAEDLRHFLQDQKSTHGAITPDGVASGTLVSNPSGSIVGRSVSGGFVTSDGQHIKIVPKGLRSFDAHDADFFLELLPGPRDREGLPDSLRFWKTRIEEVDADDTFSVGMIYGPSGCGKSSLVKAGLLPRLSEDVTAVYIEATPRETETRLLHGLRKRCPALADNLSLKEVLAALRRGQGGFQGKKVVIFIDQFEQWLHATKDEQNTDLVQALRQCDGGRVQCIVMVRDDFWMAVTRFLTELEIAPIPGKNTAAADLFDLKHAKTVLRAFGQAFGTLPEYPGQLSKEQKEFVEQAVSGLAEEGKVICVRLALFAEIMKGKTWNLETLEEMGGTEGVGVTFLEETFSSQAANPRYRFHQQAARAILNALLPESGTNIKGHMRSYGELLEASGYGNRSNDFDDLIRILDGEIRLITPTDPEGKERSDQTTVSRIQVGQKYYQLTHDYLVHSLRDWLSRKQKETRRGRAELLLEDRALVWNARPENRQLPSLLQWLQIQFLTNRKRWTPPQLKMMRKAGNHHAVRYTVLGLFLMVSVVAGLVIRENLNQREKAYYADALVRLVLDADISQVSSIIKDMHAYRAWTDKLLVQEKDKSASDLRKQLHVSLALLPVDPGQVKFLFDRMLKAELKEVVVIRDALLAYKDDLTDELWKVLENQRNDQEQRIRAACALSTFAPEDSRWNDSGGEVAGMLVMQKPFVIVEWTNALKGVRRSLLPALADFLVDENRTPSERGLIASVYDKYAAETPGGYTRLEQRLTETAVDDATLEQRIAVAKRRANIGAALIAMNQGENAWPLLKQSSDPTLRSFLIEWLEPFGVDHQVLMTRLNIEQDISIRRAILVCLGGYGVDRLSVNQRLNLLPQLRQLYQDDPDPGIHGTAGRLLRSWQMHDDLKSIETEFATGNVAGERRWYLNRQGQTMVVIPEPGDISMGQGKEKRICRIDRNFAIAADEVTVEQFLRFQEEHQYFKPNSPTNDCPVNAMSWYEAVAYCNWLSNQEGLPRDQWCYEPSPDGKYQEGMKMAPHFLRRTGYRLPTEAEWEYACRAGADTTFSFGDAEELLGQYAWFVGNSLVKSHPVGSLRGNDLGLFDMQGNVWEWCQDAFGVYDDSLARKDQEENLQVNDLAGRVQRGGSFNDQHRFVRCAGRYNDVPIAGDNRLGFRVARTLPNDNVRQTSRDDQ